MDPDQVTSARARLRAVAWATPGRVLEHQSLGFGARFGNAI